MLSDPLYLSNCLLIIFESRDFPHHEVWHSKEVFLISCKGLHLCLLKLHVVWVGQVEMLDNYSLRRTCSQVIF